MASFSQARANAIIEVLRVKELLLHVVAQRRPWKEYFDHSLFSVPRAGAEAGSRAVKNLHYFKVNYFLWLLSVIGVCMFFSPASIVSLLLVGVAWFYVFLARSEPVILNNRELTDREKLFAMSALTFVFVFYVTDVAAVLFSGFALGAASGALHAVCRVPDELFLYEEGENTGFFSFLKTTR